MCSLKWLAHKIVCFGWESNETLLDLWYSFEPEPDAPKVRDVAQVDLEVRENGWGRCRWTGRILAQQIYDDQCIALTVHIMKIEDLMTYDSWHLMTVCDQSLIGDISFDVNLMFIVWHSERVFRKGSRSSSTQWNGRASWRLNLGQVCPVALLWYPWSD